MNSQSHNIRRATRTANAQHNKPANRRARRNAARIMALADWVGAQS